MPFDAPYQQMIHLLSSRGLGWFGRQIDTLPCPLPPGHPTIASLAEFAAFAPILAGLRASPSPLETFLRRRLTPEFLKLISTETAAGRGSAATAQVLLVGKALAAGTWPPGYGGLKQRGYHHENDNGELEALLRRPLPRGEICGETSGRFATLLMEAYAHGACRPHFSSARAFGEIFATCLNISDWALVTDSLPDIARMVYCLCLIDPDFDTGELVARIMSCQRPDGSFPNRVGHDTADQDLATASQPTILAVAALHMALYRRWRQPPHLPLAA
jgi:hypothetical protein